MKHIITLFCLISFLGKGYSQGDSPLSSIAQTEDTFNAGNLVARMVEALGFRYYWATEGLRDEDLKLTPVESARNTLQTIRHIHALSTVLLNTLVKEKPEAGNTQEMTFKQIRHKTLRNFEKAIKILKQSKDPDFEDYQLSFAGGRQLPFWNVINGPLADAIYHTGQIVLMRRMSGNPINPKVNVLSGSLRN